MWFSLPQVADSEWRCWKNKQQVTNDFCLLFHISLPSFSLQMKWKPRTSPSARISLSLPYVCVPPAIWASASLMGQLILHRNKYVIFLFPLPLSNVIFFLWIALTSLICLPSPIFNILFFPCTPPTSVLVGFENRRLSTLPRHMKQAI